MRGKGSKQIQALEKQRITPAYAGKRQGSYFKVAVIEDHPRLCGEKEADVQFLFHSLGSPPPMRGKVVYAVKLNLCFRITPAYAGKRQIAVGTAALN